MYSLRSTLAEQPVISLQTGQVVAQVTQPILEVSNLEVFSFLCGVPQDKRPLLLICRDIRQFAVDCIIVDDEDALTDPDDIVRIDTNLKNHYTPIGKPVIDDSGRKLGTVEDYSVNLETNRVQQLYVRGSFLRALMGSNLIVDRTQITDITPTHITVRDTAVTDPLMQDSLPETPLS